MSFGQPLVYTKRKEYLCVPLIKIGLNQVNQLAVIARGTSIYLYINQQYITSASDSSYHSGQIGVFGGNSTQAPSDVVFSHIQVWKV